MSFPIKGSVPFHQIILLTTCMITQVPMTFIPYATNSSFRITSHSREVTRIFEVFWMNSEKQRQMTKTAPNADTDAGPFFNAWAKRAHGHGRPQGGVHDHGWGGHLHWVGIGRIRVGGSLCWTEQEEQRRRHQHQRRGVQLLSCCCVVPYRLPARHRRRRTKKEDRLRA